MSQFDAYVFRETTYFSVTMPSHYQLRINEAKSLHYPCTDYFSLLIIKPTRCTSFSNLSFE